MTRSADIDRMARLLEGDHTAAAEADGEERLLAEVAGILRASQVETPPMRPEFRAALRAQVVEAARENTVSAPLMTRLRDSVERFKYSTRLATGTGIAAMALSTGGVAGAAEHAQPGELLYGVKTTIEDARLALTFDDAERASRGLSYAADRLDEAELEASENDDVGAAIALRGADQRVSDAAEDAFDSGRMGPLGLFAGELSATQDRVEALLPRLGPEAATEAASLLLTIDQVTTTIEGTVGPADATPTAPIEPDGADAPIVVPGVEEGIDLPDAGGATTPDPAPVVPAPDSSGGLVPDVGVPDVGVPDVGLPEVEVPEVEVPGLEDALDDALDALEDGAEGVLDGVEEGSAASITEDGLIPADTRDALAPSGGDDGDSDGG